MVGGGVILFCNGQLNCIIYCTFCNNGTCQWCISKKGIRRGCKKVSRVLRGIMGTTWSMSDDVDFETWYLPLEGSSITLTKKRCNKIWFFAPAPPISQSTWIEVLDLIIKQAKNNLRMVPFTIFMGLFTPYPLKHSDSSTNSLIFAWIIALTSHLGISLLIPVVWFKRLFVESLNIDSNCGGARLFHCQLVVFWVLGYFLFHFKPLKNMLVILISFEYLKLYLYPFKAMLSNMVPSRFILLWFVGLSYIANNWP